MDAMDPEPSSDAASGQSSVKEAVAIGVVLIAMAVGGYWWLGRSSVNEVLVESGRSKFEKAPIDPDYVRYVGDVSCRECHPGEAAAHSRSGHSRTLRPVSKVDSIRKLDGRVVADPERSGVVWRYAFGNDQFTTERIEGSDAKSYVIDYVFGSGHHAMTFGTLLDRNPIDPTLLEHRVTRFAHDPDLGLTPGHKYTPQPNGNTPHGWPLDAVKTIKCFSCHVTVLSNRGPSFLDEATMIPNVSCERCHGPAKEHVEAARRGATGAELAMKPRLAEASALEQMKACGECHRTPEMVTPGEIRVDVAPLARHQPVGLMQSACFRKSEGKLNCSTCHDPHAKASTDRVAYQERCLDCHGKPEQTSCSVSPSPSEGCIDCHMPRRDVARGMMMSDHWIRVVREGEK